MRHTRAEVQEGLQAVFRRHVPPGVDVTATSTIGGDLALDSLAVMEVVADVEDRFGLPIPDETLPEMRTVGDVCDALVAYLEAKGRLLP
jgi:acyl carrier protein